MSQLIQILLSMFIIIVVIEKQWLVFGNAIEEEYIGGGSTAGSTIHLISWLLQEQEIYNQVKLYVKSSKNPLKLHLMESFLSDFENTYYSQAPHTIYKINVATRGSYPFLIYKMISRYCFYIRNLGEEIMLQLDEQKLEERLKIIRHLPAVLNQIPKWPTQAELDVTIERILQLYITYSLPINEFISEFAGLETNMKLNAYDCVKIGQVARSLEYYSVAVEWIEEAKYKVQWEADTSISLIKTIKELEIAINNHDEKWEIDKYEDFVYTYKLSSGNAEANVQRVTNRQMNIEYFQGKKGIESNYANYVGLCSGDNYQTEKEKSRLKCWVEYGRRNQEGWFVSLNPIKKEILSKTPLVLQIHNAFGDKLVEEIIRESETRLRQLHSNHDSNDTNHVEYSVWLSDTENAVALKVCRIIEQLTGLKVCFRNASENLRVGSHTFGGIYDIHLDSILPTDRTDADLETKGNLISTFMVYLSEVISGGYTVFPQGGFGVRPIKGSALFWYNLNRDGVPNNNSWHGGCPVILGNKWVATKWIRYLEQYQRRKCLLEDNND